MKKVFVSGCFDILHGGHIEFFSQAKALGDYLIVSFAGNESLLLHKKKKSSVPDEHKKRILKSLSMVDEVVVGNYLDEIGLDFKNHFLDIKPDFLVVTEDDKYSEKKKELCDKVGAEYVVLPKSLNYEKISTSEIISYIKAPFDIPLRVDFAGGWLDVPKFSQDNAYIVNCTISPKVSLNKWDYEIGSGLGGSAAYSILTGKNGVEEELNSGVGWQDPAAILETGLCVFRSGEKPILEYKVNPDFLEGKMALYWTGSDHHSASNVDNNRDFNKIIKASHTAKEACNPFKLDINKLASAINLSYEIQKEEGMETLPEFNEIARKYSGGGYGGYALYLFKNKEERDLFLKNKNTLRIEPYIKEYS
ncbi:MAG: adenylyltransferase/cytidyltransferase family protein [Patescibacteria group bacterium]|jgi:cytidyltransferase-like protein|nr:adenylyltransferase/cytidyltransferase family protein [Patescibacteria group bacterium]